MNTNPRISIIVPIYNVESYLDRCMQSLLNQTLKDIEIIMVDDGSPDNCPLMCDEYAKKDSRVKVIHKNNGGLGYARNSGLDVATGEFIAFVDSDDYVELRIYEILYNEIVKQHADAAFCGIRREASPGKYIYSDECSEIKIWEDRQISDLYLNMIASGPKVKTERLYEMSVWRSLYKKSLIDTLNLRFLSEREYASEDLPFNIDYLRSCKKVVMLPDVLHTYCLNLNSLTTTYKKEKFDRFVNLYLILKEKTHDVDKDGLHVDRFLIGYTRAHLKSLIKSKLRFSDKLKIIKSISHSSIWQGVKYDYWSLPIHSALCQHLMIHASPLLLYFYIRVLTAISK